jgi:hypothetical protein
MSKTFNLMIKNWQVLLKLLIYGKKTFDLLKIATFNLLKFDLMIISLLIECFPSVRPVINIPQQEVTFARGEDAVIECIIEAFPPGINYWEMDTGN